MIKANMQILVLLNDLFDKTGGIQTFSRCLVKALDEISHEGKVQVNILVLNDKGKNSLCKKYITSQFVHYKFFNRGKLSFILDYLSSIKRADIVFLGHINFLPLAAFVRKDKNVNNTYLVSYGIEAWRRLSLLQNFGMHCVNKIISISNFTKKKIEEINNIISEEIIILPCCLDPIFLNENIPLYSRDKLSLPKGKIILTVSRLEGVDNYKNIDLVIRALPDVLESVPNVYYVVVGDGDDQARLKKIAFEVGVSDKVIFTGRVEADLLPLYYNFSDVFILPSIGEGFGITFLEAMYYSKPCIGANAGGIPEVIIDGKTGFLVEPNDIKSIVNSLIKILNNETLGNTMGVAGRRRIEEEFSFKIFRNKLNEYIKKV